MDGWPFSRLAELPMSAVVIEAVVSKREWQDRNHPYRQHPYLADGVPCIVRLGRFGAVFVENIRHYNAQRGNYSCFPAISTGNRERFLG
jgi:hypothetical protein